MGKETSSRIINMDVDHGTTLVSPNHMQMEQKTALQDLLEDSYFQPVNDDNGPYDLRLSVEQSRLVLRMRNDAETELPTLVLSIRPYQRLIQDYFLMIESYENARKHSTREKLEAIDMGRRGVHNEGAELIISRLKDKIEIDHDTARRFFTLICSLLQKDLRLMR